MGKTLGRLSKGIIPAVTDFPVTWGFSSWVALEAMRKHVFFTAPKTPTFVVVPSSSTVTVTTTLTVT